MDEEERVRSVIPIEETIIDPLYEPLKLNRYALCSDLQRLKDVSHLRYGFSPYLLFDVAGWKEVVKVIKGNEELSDEEAIFSDLLKKYLDLLGKLGDKGIKRNTLIRSLFECRNTIVTAHKAIKMLFDVIQIEDMVEVINKKEIFKEGDFDYNEFTKLKSKFSDHKKLFFNNIKNSAIYEQILGSDSPSIEKTIEKLKEGRGESVKELEENTSKIRKIYNAAYYSTINSFDGSSKKKELYTLIKNRFNKITYLYQLDYPVKVKCPKCEEKPYMFMCEEGKIYSMKEALLRTFELRRARWLQMSGSLHTVHRASTHTRLSHQIGSMIVGVNALREMDVYLHGDMSMSLGEYLLMRGELHEFLMANFLHDIGHSPLSHVLEPNPLIDLDHEEITRNLILGRRIGEEGGGVDWYVTERYLLKTKAIKDFEHRFFENRDDPIYEVGEKKGWKDEKERKANFLKYLGNNNEMLESEIITITEVLDNFGVDRGRVVEILTGKVFRNVTCSNPSCQKYNEKYKILLKIEEDTEELMCKSCRVGNIVVEDIEDIEKIYDTQFLNKLIHSEIDFDRMDHVKRDSVVCGLSLSSFRLLELLGSMSVILPDSGAYKEIHNRKSNKPYILISENGPLYIMNLLTARRSVFNDILYSNENNWINGVVNQITALAVKYLPHLKTMLPFITDQILMQFYTNDLFLGTQIEKLNKLFQGKIDCSGYGKPMRYKLKDEADVTKDDLRRMYDVIKKINDSYDRMDMIAVVFYTNIEAEEGGRGHTLKEKTWDDTLIYGKKFDGEYYPFQELVNMEEYQGITRERFPKRPNELDVKNLFYVWVGDFVVSDGNTNENNGNKTKNKWIGYIKTEIGAIWTDEDERKIDEFRGRFVDLDQIHRGDENDSY